MTTSGTVGERVTGRGSASGAIAVLTAAALWGTVGPAQVLAASAADPGALGVARLLVGGLALGLFCAKPAAWRAVLRKDVVGWVLLAGLATGVYQISFMHAVDRLGAALGTTVALGVAPVATGICARWWTSQHLTWSWLLGTAASVVGCVVLLNPWSAAKVSTTGVAVALLSGTCYGVYTVAAKQFLRTGVPALPATTVTLVIAGVALSPLLLLHPQHLTDTSSLVLVGWISIVATAAAYAAFVYGLHRTSAPTAGTLSLAEPLLAAVLGVVALHEQLSPSAVVGCLALLAGLVTVTVLDIVARSAAGRPDGRATTRSSMGSSVSS